VEAKDLVVTPIFIFLILTAAFLLRPLVTDSINRKYFIPALVIKIIGAIAVGLIYQFYYEGGDTFTYFSYGSKYIYEAFMDSPVTGIKLIFASSEYQPDTFQYASKIYTYGDSASYFVVRVAGVFDLLTFNTYSATAVLFATASFSGVWALFLVFYREFPRLHFYLAIACLFIPSVVFWGSGLLKDTLTLGALGWATYSVYQIFIAKRKWALFTFILLINAYVVYVVKIYILICFIPAAFLWVFTRYIAKMQNLMLKILIAPVFLTMAGISGYYAIKEVAEENRRYNLETISKTAEATARWIHYVSVREGGSAYTLGDFDYSTAGIIRKFPQAIWVTLYRPYLWEAHNVVMLLSAFESLAMLALTLMAIFKTGFLRFFRFAINKPILLFCFAFAISFAFAVGISTYNFGSLVRYKIPMMPFFISALFIMPYLAKSDRKVETLALVE
jgi:hypothetical protein